jgi:hypothetical protein
MEVGALVVTVEAREAGEIRIVIKDLEPVFTFIVNPSEKLSLLQNLYSFTTIFFDCFVLKKGSYHPGSFKYQFFPNYFDV